MSYNGWTNYETWAVKLWLDNEQSSYYDMTSHAAEGYETRAEPNVYDFASWLEEYVREYMLPDDINGLASDLLNAAMSEVDWQEMAKAYLDDAKE
jgi:hypothetical protein